MIFGLFGRRFDDETIDLYGSIVAEARRPVFSLAFGGVRPVRSLPRLSAPRRLNSPLFPPSSLVLLFLSFPPCNVL